MYIIFYILIFLIFFTTPIYWFYKLIRCFCNKNEVNGVSLKIEYVFTVITFIICFSLFSFINSLVKTGLPLTKYEFDSTPLNIYTPLSFEHSLTLLVFFTLGVIAYYLLKSSKIDFAPIPYVILCSIVIINIIFSLLIFTQLIGVKDSIDIVLSPILIIIGLNYLGLSFMYISLLKSKMDNVRVIEEHLNKKFKNKWFNKIYIFFIKYNNKPILWIITLFPVFIIIQLILVLFGQQPDSFIKVFFDTSNYTYSQVIPPDPIIIPGDSHYLCTVSARGHKKIVKPLRAGIRGNKRILVNRQLLVANAFENILEQYTPKTHKIIRYFYDKYGYPLSKHINTKFSADLTYFLMKPLEWIFLIVLYSIDKNPENRIHIQYSELRK